ncbi:hypothetical protein [Thalassomonas sp. RHCl1]|uniref:hypothetical protein n=1 Tax=Thalassomonas sp. RHCl1 TaxID=2995320 RepID=UPI00248AA195|nr:hypothetical protein [Thalassomonas sp. RHCl1]
MTVVLSHLRILSVGLTRSKRLKPSAAVQAQTSERLSKQSSRENIAPLGNVNNLVVMLRFARKAVKARSKPMISPPLATVAADVTSFKNVPGSGTFKYRVKAQKGSEQSG